MFVEWKDYDFHTFQVYNIGGQIKIDIDGHEVELEDNSKFEFVAKAPRQIIDVLLTGPETAPDETVTNQDAMGKEDVDKVD